MKFALLSTNTMTLIDEALKNNTLLKLIDNNSTDPLNEKEVVNKGGLVMKKIIPAPFNGQVPELEETNLRIFFPDGRLQNRAVLDTVVTFQIVLHNDLWNIYNGCGKRAMRPYEIMSEIVSIFEDRTIEKLGVIHFKRFSYHSIDKDYGLYNLEAEMTTI